MATKPDCLRRPRGPTTSLTLPHPVIWEMDGLWSTAKLREMCVHAGGNQHSLDADQMFGMYQYLHLYFMIEHPMAHIAKNDGRIENLQWIYNRRSRSSAAAWIVFNAADEASDRRVDRLREVGSSHLIAIPAADLYRLPLMRV